MEFEWDENTRAEVARRHGVDLVHAALIFEGHRLTWTDDRQDYGDVREISVGMVDGVCFVVVHTSRDGVVGLITAWKGGRNEQRRYQASLAGRNPTHEG